MRVLKTLPLWNPMRTAPRDGTVIIVTMYNNGDYYVVPAAWVKPDNNDPLEGFWAFHPSKYSDEEFYNRLTFTACTPVLWMPLPDMEPESRLRRAHSNTLRAKSRKRIDKDGLVR